MPYSMGVSLNSALPGKDVFAQTLFILCVINMKTNKYSIQFDPMPGWGLEGFTAVPCSIILTYTTMYLERFECILLLLWNVEVVSFFDF